MTDLISSFSFWGRSVLSWWSVFCQPEWSDVSRQIPHQSRRLCCCSLRCERCTSELVCYMSVIKLLRKSVERGVGMNGLECIFKDVKGGTAWGRNGRTIIRDERAYILTCLCAFPVLAPHPVGLVIERACVACFVNPFDCLLQHEYVKIDLALTSACCSNGVSFSITSSLCAIGFIFCCASGSSTFLFAYYMDAIVVSVHLQRSAAFFLGTVPSRFCQYVMLHKSFQCCWKNDNTSCLS
jgi:hypothetical protein